MRRLAAKEGYHLVPEKEYRQYDHGPLHMQAMIENQVDIILCDGIGPGMAQAAFENGKQVVAGAKGDADDAVQRYLAGEIESDPSGIHPCGQD